jgi:methylase of polypeptide subunit release factors
MLLKKLRTSNLKLQTTWLTPTSNSNNLQFTRIVCYEGDNGCCLFGAWVAEEVRSLESGIGSQQSLDIGTGTGLLSLMLAQKNHDALIIGVEIDEDARSSEREY